VAKTQTKKISKIAKRESAKKQDKVPVDRRTNTDRRGDLERRQSQETVAMERRLTLRRKVPRRRQIDPTTCERDYSQREIEFMSAMEQYKRASGRMFPTCSEILEVVEKLGYVQLSPQEIAARHAGRSHSPAAEAPAPAREEA
jgi:hypothetical protein